MSETVYDTIVIGGGPAGVAAAVYAARKKMATLVITERFGGQSEVSSGIENWIGETKITGAELARKLESHVRAQEGVEIKTPEKVVALAQGNDGLFEAKTESGGSYTARAVIIASGARRRRLNVPGESEFEGKGVAYCSTCDAPFFKDMEVGVVGSGNAALETIIDLFPYARKIFSLLRGDDFKGDPVSVDKVIHSPKLALLRNVEVQKIVGGQGVEGLHYKEKKGEEVKELPLGGVFVSIGSVPNSEFARALVRMNTAGEIIVDHRTCATSKKGIFAAGDVTEDPFKQNNTAAGDGVKAALAAHCCILNVEKYSCCAETEEGEETKQSYQEKMESQLKEWAVKIDLLKAKADKAKASAKVKYDEQIKELRAKQGIFEQRLQEMKGLGGEAWKEVRTGVDQALDDLRDAIKRARSKFKEKS